MSSAPEMETSAVETSARIIWLHVPWRWPQQADLLGWCEAMGPALAAGLIIAGVVYLLFGWNLFKALVMLNAAVLGALAGAWVARNTGSTLAAALLCALTAAAFAWPLMKYAVAAMGGIFGGILAASLWRAAGLEPAFAWSGALVGVVGFGLLSFILFRGSVMMYTSLQGSAMLVLGLLGLVSKYQEIAAPVAQGMAAEPLLLPIILFVPALFGLIYQQTQEAAVQEKRKKRVVVE